MTPFCIRNIATRITIILGIEKLVAVIIINEEKISKILMIFNLPIKIIPFANKNNPTAIIKPLKKLM